MKAQHIRPTTSTTAGILLALGIVYGDIGTSPLYVMKEIIHGNQGIISRPFIFGVISLIFWTVTLLTTVKYVFLALKADNHGEGGIFSLYTLLRKQKKWLIVPAMIGGAAILADGILTPAVTVTSAVEGLKGLPMLSSFFDLHQQGILLITLGILIFLFFIQQFGTDIVGKAFGPVMLLWFSFLGICGLLQISHDVSILTAIHPKYAWDLLFYRPENHLGIFILGSVFLATTGAEALYSDMGHVGKNNIRLSWPFVFICLQLNYMGQANWILQHAQHLQMENPFFAMVPEHARLIAIILATLAAIIASQALITGSFTLVSEAIKLKLLPKLQIRYPGKSIGQMYIPTVNWLLLIGCSGIVLGFQTSSRMEAAYGLAITVTMLMTTILLYQFLLVKHVYKVFAFIVFLFFTSIESIFLLASLVKFIHGGFVAVLLALFILSIMYIWYQSNEIQEQNIRAVNLKDYLPQLKQLTTDESIPTYQTNLVFLVPQLQGEKIAQQYLYSILDKKVKRAKVYWFVSVVVTDEPYTKKYAIDMMGTNFVVKVQLFLGFRVDQEVNIYLRQIIQELMDQKRLPEQPQKYSLTPGRKVGDFRFVLIREELSNLTTLSRWQRQIMQTRLLIKKFTVAPEKWFGLQYSDVVHETIPLNVGKKRKIYLEEWLCAKKG